MVRKADLDGDEEAWMEILPTARDTVNEHSVKYLQYGKSGKRACQL